MKVTVTCEFASEDEMLMWAQNTWGSTAEALASKVKPKKARKAAGKPEVENATFTVNTAIGAEAPPVNTNDDLKKLMLACIKTKGREAIAAVMLGAGYTKVSDVPADKVRNLMVQIGGLPDAK